MTVVPPSLPPSSKRVAKEQPRTRLVAPILLACLLIVAGLYSSWILLISFALLPSVLIRHVDKREKSALIFAVTGLNITGLMLALQHSYQTYGLYPDSGMLFADWVNWVMPFGLAWLGILIFMLLPAVLAAVMEILLRGREQRLREQQKLLVQIWGRQLRQGTSAKKNKDGEKKSVEKAKQ